MPTAYAFFDADGTLLDLRSMFSFAQFSLARRAGPLTRTYQALIFRTLYRWLPRSVANRLYYRRFAGQRPEDVRAEVVAWYRSLPADVLNPRVVEELEQLRAAGVHPVLVSGSSVDILRPFAEELGIEHVLATHLELADGRYTGRIRARQTIGGGKRRAMLDFLQGRGVRPESCYAFGDHRSDAAMLETVGHPVVVPGDPSLVDLARARSWRILEASHRQHQSTELPVLIVGAGPAGLVSAIQLARAGVPFRLIEKNNGIDLRSKALSISSASLELFEDLGVVEAILDGACINDTIQVVWKGTLLHEISLALVPSAYPYFVMRPQYETEAILRERLEDLGGRVEAGTRLVGLRQEPDRVVVETLDAGGERLTGEYAFVLGCDGSRSAVREFSGIPFEGRDYDMYFIMCDAEIRWSGARDRLHYFVEEDCFAILIPLTERLHRIVIKVTGEFDPDREWGRTDFQQRLAELGLGDLTVSEPEWSTSARFYDRLAAEFRRERVFLVGDAAHLFSPIGGQGMNTGVQDAYNLAWKLSLVLAGGAGEALLDSYEVERRALAQRLREVTDSMTRLIARLDRDPRGPLANFLPQARGGEFLTRTLPEQLAGTSTCYASSLESSERSGLAAGDRTTSRDLDSRCPALHDLEGRRVTLACAFEDGGPSPALAEAITRLAAELAPHLRLVVIPPSADAPDQLGRAQVIRPDRFLAFEGPLATTADLVAIRVQLALLLDDPQLADARDTPGGLASVIVVGLDHEPASLTSRRRRRHSDSRGEPCSDRSDVA